jgi:hypothetical protein
MVDSLEKSLQPRPTHGRGQGRRAAADRVQPRVIEAELPGAGGVWCRLRLEIRRFDEADGERLGLRLRMDTRPALALEERGGAQAAMTSGGSLLRLGAAAARRGLALSGAGRLLAPWLDREFSTAFECELSTARAVHGAADGWLSLAVPLRRLGVMLPAGDDGAVGRWITPPSATGEEVAEVGLLRLSSDDLPEKLRRLLGDQPFRLAMAMIQRARPLRGS